MSLLETQKKKEKEKQIREENRLKKHKCHSCQWGVWTETSYKCLFPKCLKNLWNFKNEEVS